LFFPRGGCRSVGPEVFQSDFLTFLPTVRGLGFRSSWGTRCFVFFEVFEHVQVGPSPHPPGCLSLFGSGGASLPNLSCLNTSFFFGNCSPPLPPVIQSVLSPSCSLFENIALSVGFFLFFFFVLLESVFLFLGRNPQPHPLMFSETPGLDF